MAEAQREMAEQQLRFGVIQAYYGVLIAEARKLVTEEAAAASEAEVKRIRDLHAQGVVVASDLLAMEVQLADFKQQQIQAAGDVAAAYAYLNTAMGQPIGSRPSIAGELKDAVFPAVTEESLIETALGRRQDYRQLSLELAARRQDVRASRGQYWPDLNLFAGVGHSGKDLAGGSSDYAVGASLTVNLVDFGRTSRIRQAVASRQAAEAQKDRKAAEIRLEVVRANQYYRAAEAKLKVAAGAVDQAAEAYRIAGDRHGVGLTTVTEVLRAQTALVRARMSLLAARYDYYVGYAQTLLATGQLNDVTPLAL
jgi:outer membrane protein TolC